jgi:hypothetical protein
MEIAVMACLPAKRNMDINACHFFVAEISGQRSGDFLVKQPSKIPMKNMRIKSVISKSESEKLSNPM